MLLSYQFSLGLDFSQNLQMLTGSWAEYTQTQENYLKGCKWWGKYLDVHSHSITIWLFHMLRGFCPLVEKNA